MTIEPAFFGSLARDGELKQALSQPPTCGRRRRRSAVANVMAFDPEALGIAGLFAERARVYVEGRILLNEWTTADGARRHGLSCLRVGIASCTDWPQPGPKRQSDDTRKR